MYKINRKVEYAFIALRHLYELGSNELATAKTISQKYGTPFDVTSRVLQQMGKKKIVTSEQGISGGYRLSSNLSRVSFLELVESIEGPQGLTRCLCTSECELVESCNFVNPAKYIDTKIRKLLSEMTLLEIIECKPTSYEVPAPFEVATSEELTVG